MTHKYLYVWHLNEENVCNLLDQNWQKQTGISMLLIQKTYIPLSTKSWQLRKKSTMTKGSVRCAHVKPKCEQEEKNKEEKMLPPHGCNASKQYFSSPQVARVAILEFYFKQEEEKREASTQDEEEEEEEE